MNKITEKVLKEATVPGIEGLGGSAWEVDEDLLIKAVAQVCIDVIKAELSLTESNANFEDLNYFSNVCISRIKRNFVGV